MAEIDIYLVIPFRHCEQRGMQSRTAVLESNYKFSYRGTEQLNGRPVFDFMVRRAGILQVYSKAKSFSIRVQGIYAGPPDG